MQFITSELVQCIASEQNSLKNLLMQPKARRKK